MSQHKTEFKLKHGIKYGEDMQFDVVLREPTAGDIIDASVESEKLIATPDGYQLIASPTLVGALTICKQLVSIGVIQAPVSITDFKKLHPEDMQLIQDAAMNLEEACMETAKLGESDQDGSPA